MRALPISYVQAAILNLLNPYVCTKLLPHSVIILSIHKIDENFPKIAGLAMSMSIGIVQPVIFDRGKISYNLSVVLKAKNLTSKMKHIAHALGAQTKNKSSHYRAKLIWICQNFSLSKNTHCTVHYKYL